MSDIPPLFFFQVELWPPGEAALCRSAPAWVHHISPLHTTNAPVCNGAEGEPLNKNLPPAREVLVLESGDVGFWPEGWWHRVTSTPDTRAINVW